MGTEFLVWKYRPALLVTVLFFAVYNVHLTSTDNNVAPVGKLYPKGNHWAVGHLMGKKDTGSVERVGYQRPQSPAEDVQLDRYLQPSNLVRGLARLLTRQERQNGAAPQGKHFSTGRESGRKGQARQDHDRGN
ncbi:hypothetical protein SKAU_G00357530 [Synaphobranchus kaupii]|uniref:Gastrin-releasing peptide n=1 Tax=Synaphobranchus kaupii TaxID=118154 RepID=A0A9Q1EHP8_SYNKA|nr:hypothetical protein SKAU_G00357530 [Synaphobranchus kaupii]